MAPAGAANREPFELEFARYEVRAKSEREENSRENEEQGEGGQRERQGRLIVSRFPPDLRVME